jgi:phage anti-repressor protein
VRHVIAAATAETTALDTISEVWLKDKARAVVVDDVSQFRYDACDLHEFLEVQSKFRDWFPRVVSRYNLLEGTDFVCRSNLNGKISDSVRATSGGGHGRRDYLLTLRAMQHPSVTCNTPKGYALRTALIDLAASPKQRPNLTAGNVRKIPRVAEHQAGLVRPIGNRDPRTPPEPGRQLLHGRLHRPGPPGRRLSRCRGGPSRRLFADLRERPPGRLSWSVLVPFPKRKAVCRGRLQHPTRQRSAHTPAMTRTLTSPARGRMVVLPTGRTFLPERYFAVSIFAGVHLRFCINNSCMAGLRSIEHKAKVSRCLWSCPAVRGG